MTEEKQTPKDFSSDLNPDVNSDFLGQSERQIKIALLIRSIAQNFFAKNSTKISLITVTRAKISKDLKNTTIYITVLPDSKEKPALEFAKRMRTDLRTEIKKQVKIRTIPRVEIEIDKGEKARQDLYQALRKID